MADIFRQPETVHIVSSTAKAAEFFGGLLPPDRFSIVPAGKTASAARLSLNASSPAIAVVSAPLPDENGVALSRELALAGWGVLLLVPASSAAAAEERLSPDGILVLPRPADRSLLLQAIYLLSAIRTRLLRLEKQNNTLQTKLDDIRLVDRAKLLLMQQLKMTEHEAHRYIEKAAMDRCLRRRDIAENIIRTYED